MAPITMRDYDTPEPKTYPKRKARLARDTFWKTLEFYFEVKLYRAAVFAVLPGFLLFVYLVGGTASVVPVWISVIGSVLICLVLFWAVAVADLWLCIQDELWHWNKGICRYTGKRWEQSYVSTYYYRSVCYRSEDSTTWLIYIEPED